MAELTLPDAEQGRIFSANAAWGPGYEYQSWITRNHCCTVRSHKQMNKERPSLRALLFRLSKVDGFLLLGNEDTTEWDQKRIFSTARFTISAEPNDRNNQFDARNFLKGLKFRGGTEGLMRQGYDSLLGIVQKTLQPNKPNSVTIVNANGKAESRLNNKLAGLKKMVADSIGELKTEVNEGAAAGSETQNGKQAIENLKANVACLDTTPRESEETIRSKDIASQKTQETLTAKVADLEAKLREIEEIVRKKGTIIRRLEQKSAARIQDLESQVKTKDNLLVGRAMEVSDLKAQLEALKNWIKEMSSFFNQSEILATVKGQNNSAVSREGESKTGQETPTATRFTGPTATSEATDAAVEAVPPIFFDDMTRELTEFCGPMAAVIIHDHVASLGESTGKFPKARVPELLEIISREIPYESVKNSFRERLVGSPEQWDIGSFEKWVKGDVFFF